MSERCTPNAQPDFDRVASIYRWAEYISLGPLLQQTRTRLLPHLAGSHRALILGDGDGRFTEQLLLHNPQCAVLAIDTSAAMLSHLRRRCVRSVPDCADRLHTLHQNALTLDPLNPLPNTDLVVSHFFLDCLTQSEVDQLTLRIASYLAPGSHWLVSDFTVPPNRFLRPFAAFYIRLLYIAFGLLTGLRVRHLPDPQTALRRAGFTRITRCTLLRGLLYTELWRRE
jgi:SAM-dependent methyltransferase